MKNCRERYAARKIRIPQIWGMGPWHERGPPTRALLNPSAINVTASLVRIGHGRADRARAAVRRSGGQLVAHLVCWTERRTAMHSWSRAAAAPTCGLEHASTPVLVSSVDYQVRATHSHTRIPSDCTECAMHCGRVYNTM